MANLIESQLEQKRGVKRKRTPMLTCEHEFTEREHVLPMFGVIEVEFKEWKLKPLHEERKVLILLDILLINMHHMKLSEDINKFLTWGVDWFDIFIWSHKLYSDVLRCAKRFPPNWTSHFMCIWSRGFC